MISCDLTVTTVTYEDASANTLRTEQHSYYHGNPAPTSVSTSNPTDFAARWLGLEYLTNVIDPSAGTLQTTSRAYGQRPCPGAGEQVCPTGVNNFTLDSGAAHDPQLCQVTDPRNGS